MKQSVIFIHGGNAYSDYEAYLHDLRTQPLRELPGRERALRWSDTLANDLGENFVVYAPKMPNAQNAKYLEWKIWFERYLSLVEGEVVLIGWSQGGYFLAKYLLEEPYNARIVALYLVAAPFAANNFGGEDGGDFAFDTSKVGELSRKVAKMTIVHSTDDPIVPFNHAERYAASLPLATLLTFHDKNHFLIPEFPELVALLKEKQL